MDAINLQCEYMKKPLGIDVPAPHLSWSCLSSLHQDEQTAYRVILFDEHEILWDTGKVTSNESAVNCNGIRLQSNQHYMWKVCVWNKDGVQSPFSETASFDTGFLHREWTAKWIGNKERGISLPVFIKEFMVDRQISRAMVYISAPGMYELHINGTKASETFFEPGETCYDKKVFYSSHDVNSLLSMGNNTLFVYLGKGFYYNTPVENRFNRTPKAWGELMLWCQLEIEFHDGSKMVLGTDETWLTADGPLMESCWLGGEDYDARMMKHLFDSSVWRNADAVTELPFERIEARKYPPVKIAETFRPISIIHLENGDYTVDFGTNFAGTYQFCTSAKTGQKVYFYPAENINEDGSVNQDSTKFGIHKIYDTYTFAGSTREVYMPKFVYHGMRYLQISGIEVTEDMICGYSLRCSNEAAGKIETSNSDINSINKIINRSISDNMLHVMTDCPHREKLGWLEVPHLLYNTIADNYNIAAYARKITADICDAQWANGSVPSIVPPYTTGLKEHALRNGTDTTPNDPIWCGAIIMIPFYSYKRYGDTVLLKNTYPAMDAYMHYLSSLSEEYLIQSASLNRDLGDWVALEETSVTFAVSCMYYQLAHTMAAISAVLDCPDKEICYSSLAEKIKKAIHKTFFHADTITYDTGSQTANALPLFLKIAPEGDRRELLQNIIRGVKANGYHFTTGEFGMNPLLSVLSENGYCELVYRMLLNNTPPSYKYFIDLSKTSLPETWTGDWSQNHCILGHGGGWLYEYLAGIRNDGIAFDKIIIDPYFPPDMKWLSVKLETPKGPVSLAWTRENEMITLKISIPVNSIAKIILPSNEVDVNSMEAFCTEHKTILRAASGKYEITFRI